MLYAKDLLISEQRVQSVVRALPKLASITLPDIGQCGSARAIRDFANKAYNRKPCMEIVARRLFKSSGTLSSVAFLRNFSIDGSTIPTRRSTLAVRRDLNGNVQKILWARMDKLVKKEVKSKNSSCRKGEDDIQLWIEKQGPPCLQVP
jgi:hypothetical protein